MTCACGCGLPTKRAARTNRALGHVAGEFLRFRVGHRLSGRMADHPAWKGGRVRNSEGYVMVRVGKQHPLADHRGYAYEHRLVASKMLGRLLTTEDVVHHRNEQKDDNRPENLEVTTQALHAREHLTTEEASCRGRKGNERILTLKAAGRLPMSEDRP